MTLTNSLPSHPPVLSLQIATEGRGTLPLCRPGFSEDVYVAVVPESAEKGQPLFNGELWIG